MNLHDVARKPFGTARHDWNLIPPGCNHDLVGEVNSIRRFQHEFVLGLPSHVLHRHAFQQRRAVLHKGAYVLLGVAVIGCVAVVLFLRARRPVRVR